LCANRLIELERSSSGIEDFELELKKIYEKLLITLEDFRNEELTSKEEEVFFPDEIKRDKLMGLQFKIIVYGDSEVGKTSIVLRFTDKRFEGHIFPLLE